MNGLQNEVLAAQLVVLVAGFGFAAASDLRTREVTDRLWLLMGGAGLALGIVVESPEGWGPVLLWVLVAAVVLEHMVPWDERLGPRYERFADAIDLAVYLATVGVLGLSALRWGIGPAGVPREVIAVFAVVVFSRVLFELGVLYGAADAKAVMVAGLLVPFFTAPVVGLPSAALNGLHFLPFAFNALMNAALSAVVIPIGIAAVNLRRGEFRLAGGFTGYSLPVDELPTRFVWVRDPTFAPRDEPEPETSEEDRLQRVEIARELRARGVRRVWVTPQLPFVVLIAAGALLALLAGNLLLDLLAVL